MSNNKANNVRPFTDFMFRKASVGRIPLSGTFELSPVCNFSCRMCYVRKNADEVKHDPRGAAKLDEWLRIAREACDKGMLFVLLTGGEPLLWPDFWVLYEELIKMGLLVSINTNGSLIDEAAIERFRKYPPRRINITLYGANDATYETLCGAKGMFSKAETAIDRLRESRIPVKLNCSLTPLNAADLEEMVTFAKKRELILDVTTYMFPPVRRDESMIGKNERFTAAEAAAYKLKTFQLQFGQERYKQYLENILAGSISPPGLDEYCVDPIDGKITCRAGRSCFWVTWDGYLTPCGMMNEPKVDVREEALSECWNKLVEISETIRLSGICGKCPDKDVCHACAAMASAETGSFAEIPKYLCETVASMKSIARMELKR